MIMIMSSIKVPRTDNTSMFLETRNSLLKYREKSTLPPAVSRVFQFELQSLKIDNLPR
jgi:hypothetical protein